MRHATISGWMEKLEVISESTQLILSLTRQSCGPSHETAAGGFFQHNLAKEAPSQLIRVAVPEDYPCFAEISGGKHRIAVRFLSQQTPNDRPQQIDADIDFLLYCCRI